MKTENLEEYIYNHDKAEAFLDLCAESNGFTQKKTSGKMSEIEKSGSVYQISKRFFSWESERHFFHAYYFSEKPESPTHPFGFAGSLIRKDFQFLENKYEENKDSKISWKGHELSLGFPTPVDKLFHYNWSQMGCLGEGGMHSRKKLDLFAKDIEGSILRMDQFDKSARIKAKLVKWNDNRGFGLLSSELFKKVLINIKDLPKIDEPIEINMEFDIRILNTGQRPKACDVIYNS